MVILDNLDSFAFTFLAHISGDYELKYCLYRTEKQVLCYVLNIYFENLNVNCKVNWHPEKIIHNF